MYQFSGRFVNILIIIMVVAEATKAVRISSSSMSIEKIQLFLLAFIHLKDISSYKYGIFTYSPYCIVSIGRKNIYRGRLHYIGDRNELERENHATNP